MLATSLRAFPVAATLARARAWTERLGITRVTDTTRLDRVGIPVFASIRPGAERGSLCVNAGKGITAEDARAGATLEAIEFALAEYGASDLEVVRATAREVLDGRPCPEGGPPEAILDFCPLLHARIPLDAPLACVPAEDLLPDGRPSGGCLVPAELVFLPAPRSLVPRPYFGANSNGLSSGNTLEEATLHALAEVIERDVLSFQSFRDETRLVREETLPAEAGQLAALLHRAGLQLYVRWRPNPYCIPWFVATIVDPAQSSTLCVNGGYGCHPHRAIALVRAITEAAQSRLSLIHGGRDDLAWRTRELDRLTEPERDAWARGHAARASRREGVVDYDTIPDHSARARDIPSATRLLVDALTRAGFRRILRVVYTAPGDDLQVVRVLVPGAESWADTGGRVGPRLRDFVREHVPTVELDPVCRPDPRRH